MWRYAHTDHERDAEAAYHQLIELEERGDSDLKRQSMYPLHGLADTLANNPELPTLQTTCAGAPWSTRVGPPRRSLCSGRRSLPRRRLGAGHKDTLLAQLLLSDDLLELHGTPTAVALSDAQQLEALLGPHNMYTLVELSRHIGHCAISTHSRDKWTKPPVETPRPDRDWRRCAPLTPR